MGSPFTLVRHRPPTSPSAWRIGWFLVGLVSLFTVTAVAGLLAWAYVPRVHPDWSSSVVSSGSMAPRIERGDVVIWTTEVDPDLGEGTVVMFPDALGRSTIHRIEEVRPDGRYVTRGDANAQADSDLLDHDRIDGVGRALVPLIGFPALWLAERQLLPLAALLLLSGAALVATRRVWDEAVDPWSRPDELLGHEPLAHAPLGYAITLDVAADDADQPLLATSPQAVP